MTTPDRPWLNSLTDGRLFRDWASLNVHFFMGIAYWIVLITLFSVGFSLIPILIGIPLLLFSLVSLRATAKLDQQMMAALLDRDSRPIAEDIDMRGANFGERLGMLLGSGMTWRSLIYVALKLPLASLVFSAAWILLPFIALEMLILAPLGIDMHLLTPRVTHWLAVISHEVPGLLLPRVRETAPVRKGKRDDLRVSRLETIYEDDEEEPQYILTDDGEIIHKRRA